MVDDSYHDMVQCGGKLLMFGTITETSLQLPAQCEKIGFESTSITRNKPRWDGADKSGNKREET